MNSNSLFSNIRFYILIFTISLSVGVYFWVKITIPDGNLQIIRLTQIYALTAVTYLYIALVASPVTRFFTFLPFRGQYIRARRAIGVSAFYFGLLHGTLAFFGELGGLEGLGFLDSRYILAISLSFTALVILSLMASTSFEFMIKKLGYSRWKMLHRFVYLAAVLIIIHALMLGSHFQDLSGIIPQIMFIAVGILLVLESIRFDNYLQKSWSFIPRFGVSLIIVTSVILAFFAELLVPADTSVSFLGIHAAHIQLAKDAQQGLTTANLGNNALNNIPGLSGDRTRRYTASFIPPDSAQPFQDTALKFKIYDASSGSPIIFFQRTYAYPMHLIIVDSTLNYFEHIHPTEQAGGEFDITTQFPKKGFYHLYIQFQPVGGIEQQIGFTLSVGMQEGDKVEFADQPVDTNLTKVFEDYEVTLDTHGILRAQDMSIGNDKITYIIKDAKTHQPITTLKPFMASFGHLSLINEQTYDFLHVHPNNLVAPPPDANGGPSVDFLPLGIYGPIKPGIYRAFGEFSTKIGTDFDTNFTIEVK